MPSRLTKSRLAAIGFVALAMLTTIATPVHAATFVVGTTADAVDMDPGNGVCATAAATCSLRAAMQEANALAGPDVVELPAGIYDLLATGPREDASAAGDLDVTGDLTILGAGATSTQVTSGLAGGPTAERALQVLSGTVRIVGIDIRSRHHHPTSWGGAIDNLGALTIEESTIDGHVSGGAFAGAIYNRGMLHLVGTAVRGQVVDPDGPDAGTAIYNEGSVVMEDGSLTGAGFGSNVVNRGSAILRRSLLIPLGIGRVIANEDDATLTIEDSVLSGFPNQPSTAVLGGVVFNRGTALLVRTTVTDGNAQVGGGIYTSEPGTLELRDCTVKNNAAGGIVSSGPLTIVNSTITANTGVGIATDRTVTLRSSTVTANHVTDLGAFFVSPTGIAGPATLSNTILAGNTFKSSYALDAPVFVADCNSGPLLGAPLTSEGYNLIGDTGCNITGDPTGNIIGHDPRLGPLGDNGGPTATHLLLDDSPAIDSGNPSPPGSDARACPATDQRGEPRPAGSRCDIGAVEITRCGDGIVGRGETCDDGNTVGNDCCSADCRIPTVCPTCERCDGGLGCVAAPPPDCRESTRRLSGRLRMLPRRSAMKQRIEWRWSLGAATRIGDFGNPVAGGTLAFCVFDESGSRPTVAFRAITRSGACGIAPCWKALNSGFQYRSADGTPSGLTRVLLQAGADGRARISLSGKGPDMRLPTLPVSLPLRAQLQAEGGACWEGIYTEAGVAINTAEELQARAVSRPAGPAATHAGSR